MNTLCLGIDCGTQGTKALLMDSRGVVLGRGYATHAIIERPSGAREQDPAWWVDALRAAVSQAVSSTDPSLVRAIGVSGQQHGLVVLDQNLRVIRPAKLWNDTETTAENFELIEVFGGEQQWLRRFGIIPRTGYTLSKLLWLARHEPENFTRIRHVLLPHDYLNFWLTGELKAEAGDASGTGFFDVRSLTWAHDALAWIDGGSGQLAAALPQLITAGQPVGIIRPEVAKEFGLPKDCTVSAGGGDNMMGAIGTGNVREGIVTLSLGTSATVYSFQKAPSQDATGCVAPFCSSSGGWLPLICTMNATNVVRQTLTLLGKTVDDIEPALASTDPGADGLTFLPFLNGERTPDLPLAKGTLAGISATNFTPDHLIRATIEGVSFGILEGLSMMNPDSQVHRIRLIGGGARSAGWRQLLADATGADIEIPQEEEAGCLGAAIQALYLLETQSGNPTSFEDLAERCVHLNEAMTTHANPLLASAYQHARTAYRRHLRELYGVSAEAFIPA